MHYNNIIKMSGGCSSDSDLLTVLKGLQKHFKEIDFKRIRNMDDEFLKASDDELLMNFTTSVRIPDSDMMEIVVNPAGSQLYVPEWLLEELAKMGDPTAIYNIKEGKIQTFSMGSNDSFSDYEIDGENPPSHIPQPIAEDDTSYEIYTKHDRTNPYLISYIKKHNRQPLDCGGMTLSVYRVPKDLSMWSIKHDDSMWHNERIVWKTSKFTKNNVVCWMH